MDLLINDIGPPPYQITVFESVLRHGQAVLERVRDGSVADIPASEITKAIERLEALASLCFRAMEMEFITYTMDFSTNSMDGLAGVVWGLKQQLRVLQPQPEPGVGVGQDGSQGNVCWFCGWALERVGVGVGAKYLWSLRQYSPWIANCHLVAFDTWSDFPRLEESSKEGCTLCGMLRELIKKREPHLSPHITQSQSEVGVWIDFRYLPRDEELTHKWRRNFLERADVYLTKPSVWWPTLLWWLVGESDDEIVKDELELSQPINDRPWVDENINLVRSHLATMNVTPATTSFVPTRLLDLGLSSGNKISLTITPDTHSNITYAALSYCWGPPDDALKQPKLLTSNIANLCSNISPAQLSPVMLDAITVCRDLLIPNLWIDALCIIQDSKTDWEQESQVMARVYENASLTICAMSSSSCLLPFLAPRPSWSKYRYSSPNGLRGTFRLRPVPGYDNPSPTTHPVRKATPLDQDLAASRWSQRGWVFQEKAMSPRKLFFGHAMLHLQLEDRTVVSENGVRIELKPEAYDISTNSLSESTIPIGPLLLQKRHLYELWHATVVGFAHLQWTNGTDLFPGLSGIAERFRSALGGARYLAGHWEGDLHNSLVWATAQRADANRDFSLAELLARLQKGNATHAPSWSWASRPDFLRFVISSLDQKRCRVRTHLRPEMEVVRADIRIDGTNDLGRLQIGNSLGVVGKMIGLPEVTARPEWTLTENAEWECANVGKGYLILISRDWEAKRKGYGTGNEWPPQGVTDEEMGMMKLLLMASCCSDVATPAPQPLKPGTVEVIKALNRLDYGKTFLEEPEFRIGEGRCVLCDEEGRGRDVWGLLVYPAGENRYFRVGVFFSRAQHGGSVVFDGVKSCQLDLV